MRRQNLVLIRENDDKIKVPKEPKPLRFKGLHLFTRDIHNEIRTQKTPQRKSFAQIGNLSSDSLQSLVDRSERQLSTRECSYLVMLRLCRKHRENRAHRQSRADNASPEAGR
jgi:hypothetical protein